MGLLIEDNASYTNPSQATLTHTQTAVYKFKSKKSVIKQTDESHSIINQRKSCRRETLVITYKTLFNSKNPVDPLHNLGICCSYKRVFTKDNVDKNTSCTTESRHFHGTSICAFQAEETLMDGIDRNANLNIRFNNPTSTITFDLPSSYTDIKDVCSKTPKVYNCPTPSVNPCEDLIKEERENVDVKWG